MPFFQAVSREKNSITNFYLGLEKIYFYQRVKKPRQQTDNVKVSTMLFLKFIYLLKIQKKNFKRTFFFLF